MHVEGSLMLDRRTYRRLTLSSFKGLFRVYRVLGALMLAYGGLALKVHPDLTGAFLALLGIATIFGPEFFVERYWRQLRPAAATPFHYTVTDSSVMMHSAQIHMNLPLSGVMWMRTRAEAWVVRGSGGVAIVVPRAAFTPDAQADIDRFLSASPFPRVAPSSV